MGSSLTARSKQPISKSGKQVQSACVVPPALTPVIPMRSARSWLMSGGCSLPESTSTRAGCQCGPNAIIVAKGATTDDAAPVQRQQMMLPLFAPHISSMLSWKCLPVLLDVFRDTVQTNDMTRHILLLSVNLLLPTTPCCLMLQVP